MSTAAESSSYGKITDETIAQVSKTMGVERPLNQFNSTATEDIRVRQIQAEVVNSSLNATY